MKTILLMITIALSFCLANTAQAEKEYYSVGRYNLRTRPGTQSRIIRVLKRNEAFDIITRKGRWAKVRTDSSSTGWVHTSAIGERTAKGHRQDCENCNVEPKVKAVADDMDQNADNMDEVTSAVMEKLPKPSKHEPVISKPSKFPSEPPSKHPPSDEDGEKKGSLSAEKIDALIDAAKFEAARCRSTASHVRRRTGKSTLCGIGVSKGMCYQGVKQALQRANVLDYYLPGESAYQAHTEGHLRRAGMTNVMSQYNQYTAPAGSILVYKGGGHGHGHIEIKGGKSLYCSDYCSARPVRGRQLIAVYMFK